MIFSYKEINHNIYFFHEHIAYIFRQMFLHDLPNYEEELIVHPDFVSTINAAKETILSPLIDIVKIYHELPYGDKIQLQIAFSCNNSINALSNKDIPLIKFEDLNKLIKDKLKIFCTSLWENYPQVVKMQTDFGTVKDHYDKLVAIENCDALVCPFCGIDTFEPSGGKYREAYDHINAKATYPFTSINFNLLFPACYKCNSNEKRTTNTLVNDDGTRRVIYYPYDSTIQPDDLEIKIIPKEPYDKKNLETLLRSISWEFEFTRNGNTDERLESWDGIYNIKRRYMERIGRLEKEWFDQLQRTYKREKSLGVLFNDFRINFIKSAKSQILISGMGIIKFAYFNFLFSLTDFEAKLDATIS